MSGSSGGGSGSGGVGDGVSCSNLKFDMQLSSPQAAVVATLSIGDVLDVGIAGLNGTQVLQVSKQGQAVGGLVGSFAAKLRECILGGTVYDATVLTVLGGQVRVHVEPI